MPMHVSGGILRWGILFWALGWDPAAYVDKRATVPQVCPLCQTKFTAILAMSGTRFNVRLDLRPVGPIASPWPLAVCTKCGFVLYKQDGKYSDEEIKALRVIVDSDAYKKLPRENSSYQRVAKLYEGLGKPPSQVATAYLEASWQVEDDEARNRPLLGESLKWFEKYLGSGPKKDENWKAAEFLRGELQRRLGRFDDAKAQFARLKVTEEFKGEPFPGLIAQEEALIAAKDRSPTEVAREKKP
jgi:hypothetical protein